MCLFTAFRFKRERALTCQIFCLPEEENTAAVYLGIGWGSACVGEVFLSKTRDWENGGIRFGMQAERACRLPGRCPSAEACLEGPGTTGFSPTDACGEDMRGRAGEGSDFARALQNESLWVQSRGGTQGIRRAYARHRVGMCPQGMQSPSSGGGRGTGSVGVSCSGESAIGRWSEYFEPVPYPCGSAPRELPDR